MSHPTLKENNLSYTNDFELETTLIGGFHAVH